MKKLLCILLCLLMPFTAVAAARMPELRGTVSDSADVFSAQTVSDLAAFSELAAQEAGVSLYVATVHFLDGMEPQAYAEQLFSKWELNDEALLLVCAAGEDSFASFMGSAAEAIISQSNADNLLYTSSEFSRLFRTQQYDAAIAAYVKSLNSLLKKQTGTAVRMEGLFGEQAPQVSVQPNFAGGELWREVMEAINETTVDYQNHFIEAEREENGLTAGSWIVLIILLLIVLRQGRRDRFRRREHRSGCGCSPLGWIFGLLGLGFLFRKD